MSHMDIWENIPGGGNRQCKGPEVGAYLECLWYSKEASAAGGE